jgi:hypothetical protein
MIEHLPSKHEALTSDPSTTKQKQASKEKTCGILERSQKCGGILV